MLGKEILVVRDLDADFERKLFSTSSGEQNMLGFFHYEPGELDGILNVFHEANRACPHGPAVHDRRVHLVLAIVRKYRTAARVKKRKIFEFADGRFHTVEG